MPIPTALTLFRSEVTKFQGYITNAHVQNAAGQYIVAADERSFIVDSAFLKTFIAWETFLEESFTRYLLGHISGAGRAAARHAMPQSVQNAREMLIGTQKYVDWANPEIVRRLSAIFFLNGEPIGPVVASINADLLDLKNIRNAAAHLTTTTAHSLHSIASRRLNQIFQPISVSDFLLSNDPTPGAMGSILGSYLAQLDAAAHNIANWV